MRTLSLALALAAAASITACGNDHELGPAAPDAGGGSAAVDAGAGSDGFVSLLSTSWSIDAGSEKYLCLRVTATVDSYVKAIRPVSPVGTHHSVLMLTTDSTDPDGVTECSSMLTSPAIYASGVGTTELDFPDGVGLHIHAGQQLFLNLHLFNVGEDAITGTSGIEVLPADASEIQHEAGSVLAGKTLGLTVPPGTSSQVGTCTTPANLTIFSVAPHMHLLGSHMNVTYAATKDAVPTTVMDTDYSFDDQQFRTITPFETTLGGKYVVTCSYVNTTGSTVNFGESTTDEMCFAMTYVYPAMQQPTCTH